MRTTRRSWVPVVLFALSVAVAGCGKKSDGGGDDDPAPKKQAKKKALDEPSATASAAATKESEPPPQPTSTAAASASGSPTASASASAESGGAVPDCMTGCGLFARKRAECIDPFLATLTMPPATIAKIKANHIKNADGRECRHLCKDLEMDDEQIAWGKCALEKTCGAFVACYKKAEG